MVRILSLSKLYRVFSRPDRYSICYLAAFTFFAFYFLGVFRFHSTSGLGAYDSPLAYRDRPLSAQQGNDGEADFSIDPLHNSTEYSTSVPFPGVGSTRTRKRFLPGPCRWSNDYYIMQRQNFSPWTEQDINVGRLQWQTWLRHEFPVKVPKYREASKRGKMNGRGIVYTVTPPGLAFLFTSITLLRRSGCMLPIEVWQFAGELNSTHIHAIESLGDNIRVRSADDFKNNVFPVEKGTEKGAGKASSGQAARNFHIKVAAIINSAFEEVLSLDADVMPIRNPDYLFQYPDFKEDGAIFWPDYWKTAMWNPVWAWTGIPCLDEWEQESGILVISKPKSWKALHLSMFMNHDDDTRFWRRFIHGDKDTFRFAWHATRTPFTYVQHWLVPGGFLHQPKKPKSPVEFCGNTMIQHDPDGRLLFLHTNLFKELEWELYNKSSPMLTHFKRYKRNKDEFTNSLNPSDYWKPYYTTTGLPGSKSPGAVLPLFPGPVPESYLSYAHTRGYKAKFSWPTDLPHSCIDFADAGNREGFERVTEVLPLEQGKDSKGIVIGAAEDGYMGLIYELLMKHKKTWPIPPLARLVREKEAAAKAGEGGSKSGVVGQVINMFSTNPKKDEKARAGGAAAKGSTGVSGSPKANTQPKAAAPKADPKKKSP